MISKKSIYKKKWFEEPAEYLEMDKWIIKNLESSKKAKLLWDKEHPVFRDEINSYNNLVNEKLWIDQWRKNAGMIVSGDRIAFQRNFDEYKKLIDFLKNEISENFTTIDYGCGTSMFCRQLTEFFPDVVYFLVDIDSLSLDFAFQRCKVFAKKVNKIKISEDNIVPLLPNCDAIYCKNVIEHLWYPEKVISSFCKSLKTGGFLMINLPGKKGKTAYKNDTQKAYNLRDSIIIKIYDNFELISGDHYKFKNGVFEEDGNLKIWKKSNNLPSYSISDAINGKVKNVV